MDRNRKILVAILSLLVLTTILAIADISLRIPAERGSSRGIQMASIGPGVAVVRIEGPIELGMKAGPFSNPAGAEAIIQQLDEIERSHNIKAVVLRINSPGGTVTASQEIYQKLWRLRKKNIVLVASMAEVAASGGYYVASACNYIVANQGTITGSIGVIAASPNLKRLFENFGIRMNVVKSGKHKDIFSTHRDMTREEELILQGLIDSSYSRFIKDIALGRNMNQSEILPYADGRIFDGEQALKIKFVDMVGTFEDSIEKARELAKLPPDSPIYEENRSTIQQLLLSLDSFFSGKIFAGLTQREVPQRLEYRYVQ